mmetsp:Transcript_20961/g.43963  ORF Transcript_20961/g.43963 Transcript_20961/m.43963 type:complete len:475 (-) Transcript_20961:329-1753(-)
MPPSASIPNMLFGLAHVFLATKDSTDQNPPGAPKIDSRLSLSLPPSLRLWHGTCAASSTIAFCSHLLVFQEKIRKRIRVLPRNDVCSREGHQLAVCSDVFFVFAALPLVAFSLDHYDRGNPFPNVPGELLLEPTIHAHAGVEVLDGRPGLLAEFLLGVVQPGLVAFPGEQEQVRKELDELSRLQERKGQAPEYLGPQKTVVALEFLDRDGDRHVLPRRGRGEDQLPDRQRVPGGQHYTDGGQPPLRDDRPPALARQRRRRRRGVVVFEAFVAVSIVDFVHEGLAPLGPAQGDEQAALVGIPGIGALGYSAPDQVGCVCPGGCCRCCFCAAACFVSQSHQDGFPEPGSEADADGMDQQNVVVVADRSRRAGIIVVVVVVVGNCAIGQIPSIVFVGLESCRRPRRNIEIGRRGGAIIHRGAPKWCRRRPSSSFSASIDQRACDGCGDAQRRTNGPGEAFVLVVRGNEESPNGNEDG